MRDRSLSKGITGNANYTQIIPVPGRDQVQITESFLQSKLYRASVIIRTLQVGFLVRIKSVHIWNLNVC